ncbi:MAG: hypothetical protein II973_00220 [Spirochaetaceae bacterium]|nr:hypothetical protein [Spirochaetaceae bacterium]
MKKIFYALLMIMIVFLLTSCGGGASSGGPDGGVAGLGFYDLFNGHTWSLINGTDKTSFIFAKARVTRKEFSYEGGAWVEKYSSTEKKYVLKDWTEAGQHGTIVSEDIFSNNPARYSFLNAGEVVLSYNEYAYTYIRED